MPSEEFVYGERVQRWVGAELGTVFDPTATAIGIQRQGRIVAAVVYSEWNTRSVVCHWCIRGAASRAWLWYIHHYAFRELGAHKVIAPIWSDNVKMLRIARKMGFIEEGRLVDTHPAGDICLFTLTADNCRILRDKRYGKENSTSRLT